MSMFEVNPLYRADMSKILESLRPYEQQIDELKPFFGGESVGKEGHNEENGHSISPN